MAVPQKVSHCRGLAVPPPGKFPTGPKALRATACGRPRQRGAAQPEVEAGQCPAAGGPVSVGRAWVDLGSSVLAEQAGQDSTPQAPFLRSAGTVESMETGSGSGPPGRAGRGPEAD